MKKETMTDAIQILHRLCPKTDLKFKRGLKSLSDTALVISGKKYDYTDEDLSDAMLVFMEVFMSKMFDKHRSKLNQKQLESLATKAGKSLRQTVKLFTGVDLHKVYDKKGNK